MAKLSKLEQRYIDLTYEALTKFLSGTGSSYDNADTMKYESGTLDKINEILARRDEVAKLLGEQYKESYRDARD